VRVLGVDPGASGALAVLSGGRLVLVLDMPTVSVKRGTRFVNQVDAALLAAAVRDALPLDAAAVEQVGAMPGQGVSSMFAFGRAAGVLEGVLAALNVPFTRVPPQEWQRRTKTQGGKDGARARALQLFPEKAELFARKKDDGRADAALIARWCHDEALGRL
jgi:crossover junction endodeoxyribonuclease RuvC